ncbi:MAG: peroxiredoxin [Candidatus Caenarcaniphilales bacterium]|nr:peroxiredoxin [Candidatus Caenarcaniphilales bacterium]
MAKVGSNFPDFSLQSYSQKEGSKNVDLNSLKGKVFILAFYPKDNTPGCTKEMCAFRDDWAKFAEAGIRVFGVSLDSIKSHESFAAKFEFASLELLSDSDGDLSNALLVGEDHPKRTLFVVDKEGIIREIIEGMPNNAELLTLCQSLK